MLIFPDTSTALEQAVSNVSAAFGAMANSDIWQLVANTDIWYSQGSSPTASAGNGSTFLAKGQIALFYGSNGAKVAVIQDSAAGKASLTRCITY